MKGRDSYFSLPGTVCAAGALFFSTGSLAGTVLADTAAAMSPGSWTQLQTGGIKAALSDSVTGGVTNILPYADKMHWDPVTSRVYFINSDDPGDGRRFVAYDEATNAWVTLPDPWTSMTVAHQYGLVDIDVAGRRIYSIMSNGESISAYDLTTQTWESLSMPASTYSCCGAASYFPERNSLIFVHGSELRERLNSGTWRDVSTSVTTTYHSVSYYDPVHKLVLFGGGNDSDHTFYKLDQNGQVTALKSPPIDLESPRVEFVLDPATGNFLVFAIGEKFYYYDTVRDTFTAQSTANVPTKIWGGAEYNASLLETVAAAIPRYGVAFFTSCAVGGDCSVHLYKYTTPPIVPNAPASLSAN